MKLLLEIYSTFEIFLQLSTTDGD